jgi:hypothetical protein
MTPLDLFNPKMLLQGESTSDLIADKGFSPDSNSLNLIKEPGKLYFLESPSQVGNGTITGAPIATAYDKNFLGNDAYFLDDEGAFYYLSGTTLTKAQTVTADTFTLGTTDMLQFLGDTFATSATRVIRLTGSNLATVDSSWWTGLTTAVRHPLEKVENSMYIGDGNLIHVWNGTTSTSAAVTLPTDVNITSLRKHPDGVHLVAFCGLTANYSHTKPQGGRIYIIDTVIKDWIREIDIEAQVEGSRLVGGIIYVTYGAKVGYFTGDGIKFLRKLSTSATTYSQNINNMEDILLIRDGVNVLAFGDLGAGNVWWNCYQQPNANTITTFTYVGDNKVVFGSSDGAAGGTLYIVDYDNAGTYGAFYSNRILFPSLSVIHKLILVHDVSNASGTTAFDVYHRDIDGDTQFLKRASYVSQSVSRTVEDNIAIQADFFQIRIIPSNDDTGYKLGRIYYAAAKE